MAEDEVYIDDILSSPRDEDLSSNKSIIRILPSCVVKEITVSKPFLNSQMLVHELYLLYRMQESQHVIGVLSYDISSRIVLLEKAPCDIFSLILSEKNRDYFFFQMLVAIHHCHSRQICHLDIKSENIVIFGELSDKFRLALIDFDCARENYFRPKAPRKIGTINCSAPECSYDDQNAEFSPCGFKSAEYIGEAADIYSAGILMVNYYVTRGYLTSNLELEDLLTRFNDIEERTPLIQLIDKMILTNPTERISLNEILNNAYFKSAKLRYGQEIDLPEDEAIFIFDKFHQKYFLSCDITVSKFIYQMYRFFTLIECDHQWHLSIVILSSIMIKKLNLSSSDSIRICIAATYFYFVNIAIGSIFDIERWDKRSTMEKFLSGPYLNKVKAMYIRVANILVKKPMIYPIQFLFTNTFDEHYRYLHYTYMMMEQPYSLLTLDEIYCGLERREFIQQNGLFCQMFIMLSLSHKSKRDFTSMIQILKEQNIYVDSTSFFQHA